MGILLNWLSAWPSFLLAFAALGIPGLLWGLFLGLRGRFLAAATVPLSAFIIGVSALIAGWLGAWWGWLFVASFTTVLCVVTFGVQTVRRQISRPSYGPVPKPVRAPVWLAPEVIFGVLIGGALSARGAFLAIVSPDLPVQTWDGLYHLSAAQFVFSTGNGSALTLAAVANPEGLAGGFYPSGWHTLVALVMEATANSVIASNVVAVVIMTVVWPLGVALFTNSLFPQLRFAPLAAALLAAASTAYPERLASYGTLWPLLYAYALVPFVLALLVYWLRGKPFNPNWVQLGVIVAGVAAIGLAHPQGVLAFIIIGIFAWGSRTIKALRDPESATTSGRMLLYAAIPVVILGVFLLSRSSAAQMVTGYGGRTSLGDPWPEFWGAIVDGQLTSQGYGIGAGWWIFAVLFFLGAAALLVKRTHRWLLLSWGTAVYLYLVATTLQLPGYKLVGFWYSDPVRLGGIVPLVAVPIMAIGAAWVASGIWSLGVDRAKWAPGGSAVLIGAAMTVTLIGSTGILGMHVGSHQLWINYNFNGETGLNGFVGEDELEMIGRLAEELPEDAKVIGSPFTGAPMVFAVAGIDTVFRIYAPPQGDDYAWLAENFNQIGTDPQVCEILNDRGINYFYYDPIRYRLGDGKQSPWFSGLEHPGDIVNELEIVDQGGTATLYRLNICD